MRLTFRHMLVFVRSGSVLSRALLMIFCCSFFSTMASASPPIGGVTSDWSMAETEHFRYRVQSPDSEDATNFAANYGPYLELGLNELTLLFPAGTPATTISVYVYTNSEAFDTAVSANPRRELGSIVVRADGATVDLSLLQPQFEKLSLVEAENDLRHSLSHIVTSIASGGMIPWGFDEGIAQYVERPVNERLARTAALVQTANETDKLLSWFDMNAQNPADDPSQAAAQSYATVAFLIDRYDLVPLRAFLTALQTESTWRAAMTIAYARDPNAIEDQFREDLRRWTSTKWRDNLVSGFNLEPAKRLLDQANYNAAKTKLEPSLELYGQLNAPAAFESIKQMVAQCDVGIQAESLMTQAHDALTQHAYERAQNLLAQARLQFGMLPETQQPTELLATYEQLALHGVNAGAKLDSADLLGLSWRDYVDARDAAVSAGTSFASLGDTDESTRAQSLVDDLDKRQRRIVMSLGALAVLTFIWLALWLRARGPAELDWR